MTVIACMFKWLMEFDLCECIIHMLISDGVATVFLFYNSCDGFEVAVSSCVIG